MENNNVEKVRIMRLDKDYIPDPESGEKAVGGSFFIPQYQRGYRWNEMQVEQLLDDLLEFDAHRNKQDENQMYCLQPVVVKWSEEDNGWTVVDGQQRLTTIFIILACLRNLEAKRKKEIYEIHYASKPELWDCLKSLGDDAGEVEVDYSDIDKYHITTAYNTVYNWARKQKSNPAEMESFAGKLTTLIRDTCFVIWYEVRDPDAVPEIIFSNINMGKIPLTNAELIKALLLKKDNFTEKEDVLGEQTRIAVAWDQMEHSLHKEDFWLFLTNDADRDVRIETIFDIMARHIMVDRLDELAELRETNGATYLFIVFSRKLEAMVNEAKKKYGDNYRYADVLKDFWRQLTKYYQMFTDWYEMREWHHLVGYWIAARQLESKKIAVGEILFDLSCRYRGKSKTAFTDEVKEMIIRNLFGGKNGKLGDDESVDALGYEDFCEDLGALRYNAGVDKVKIHKILLLFNVVTTQKKSESASIFPFHLYKQKTLGTKMVWNLEHIHSVTTDYPARAVDREKWVQEVRTYLGSVDFFKDLDDKNIAARLETITDFSEDSKEFQSLYTDIAEAFSGGKLKDDAWENNISNLTLLDESTNKSYQNDIFPWKRKIILEKMGTETFIPICTKNVFLKYYTKEVKQFYVWDEDDRKCYFSAMCSTLFEYLTGRELPEAQTDEATVSTEEG